MPRALRIPLVIAALIAAVAAFVVLRPQDDSPAPEAAATPAPETPAAQAPGAADATRTPTPTPTPRPKPPLLTAASPKRLSAEKGETVRFRVRHPSAEELHVHGYDITRQLPAGRTVNVQFRADLEGIFEIELEHSHTPLGSLRVEP